MPRLVPALVLLAFLFLGVSARAPGHGAPARILVGYSEAGTSTSDSLESLLHLRREATIPQLGVHVVTASAGGVDAALAALRADPRVRYAQLEGVVRALRIPNDELWPTQWSPRKTGAPRAWDLTTGSSQVVVAVVDTGVDPAQPDLLGKLVPGHDYVNGDDDPRDDNGHGTAVAGIVGASSDNGIGVAGYCWRCRVMPVKVLGADGLGSTGTLAQGMVWAVDHGARVLNASLGSTTDDLTVAGAAQYARMHGVLVVAAAGNDSSGLLEYPAALPDVVSVSASDEQDRLYGFSNSNARLAAPGENSSTGRGGRYVSLLGTSSAAPVVSGIAGLAFSAAPNATPTAVAQAMEDSAVPIPGVAFGRVDARGTLQAIAPWLKPPVPTSSAARGTPETRRVFSGRLARRARSFRIVVRRAGLLRAKLTLRPQAARRVVLSVRRRGRMVASARGRRLLRLRARVRRGIYRLVVSPAGEPVSFTLTVSYPRSP